MDGQTIEFLNKTGTVFCNHAFSMLIQSGILIMVLLVIDFLLRKHVKAVLRYCIWLLVFVKLVIPPAISLPTGIGYWLGDHRPAEPIAAEAAGAPASGRAESAVITYSAKPSTIQRNADSFTSIPATVRPSTETLITAEATPVINKQAILFLGWLAGVAILVAMFLQRTLFVKRIIARSKSVTKELKDILSDCSRQLGIEGEIDIRVSENLFSPAACGLLKSKIILPFSLLKQCSSEKIHTTLLHELIHIKRKDIWVNSLQTALQILYFYNPMVWVANIIVRKLREQAVDETVLVYLGDKADTYSRTLVDIAEVAFARPSLGLNMIGVVESKKALAARIKHILSRPFPKTAKIGAAGFTAIIIIALVLLPMARANRTQTIDSADELIEKIIESENNIKDVQAHFVWYGLPIEDNITFGTYDWGHENGKEFLIEYDYDDEKEPYIAHIHTFDGNIQINFDFDLNRNYYGALIRSLQPELWNGNFVPKVLLGYSLNSLGRDSLGEFLSKSRQLEIREEKEQINGCSCIVLEAIDLPITDAEGKIYWSDFLVWIDTERDFRPLKMEKYKSHSEEDYAENRRWNILTSRIDNIELEQIDGVWFPIKGDRQNFRLKEYLPPDGMTRKQFNDAYADSGLTPEQIEELMVPVIEPSSYKRRIEISDIKINQGIKPEEFTIEFADGWQVHDEFIGKSYIVGDQSEIDAYLSDDELLAQISTLSPEELVKIIHPGSLGTNTRKWMAVIYRLAEIGSSAVPAIVAELESTDNPIIQSKLAFTLRAIGDVNTVPGLINALENSGFTSDFGIGEVDETSKIEMFYWQHQMDTSRPNLGLGRPVREITITLEQLTGHTEGHDHFYTYGIEGNRLSGGRITPELIDRQREHRRTVAGQWRTWWQANKDTIKTPPPPPEPIQAVPEPDTTGGVIAAPDGSTISMAIVPNIGDNAPQPNLTEQQYQQYLDDLTQNGPYRGALRGDSFQWGPIMGDASNFDGLPLSVYENRFYILTCARAQYVLTPDFEGRLIWGLEDVEQTLDENGWPAILVLLDETGSELLKQFTQANIGNRLAIAIDYYGGVCAAPYINSVLEGELVITGDFPEDEIPEIIDRLRKGMIPESPQPVELPPEIIEAVRELKKDDLKDLSPLQTVNNFFLVGLAGEAEKLAWFFPPESELADGITTAEFNEIADGGRINIINIYDDGSSALVITSEIDEEGTQLGLLLSKESDFWLIDDGYDFDNPKDELDYIDRFLNAHPNAKSTLDAEISIF